MCWLRCCPCTVAADIRAWDPAHCYQTTTSNCQIIHYYPHFTDEDAEELYNWLTFTDLDSDGARTPKPRLLLPLSAWLLTPSHCLMFPAQRSSMTPPCYPTPRPGSHPGSGIILNMSSNTSYLNVPVHVLVAFYVELV